MLPRCLACFVLLLFPSALGQYDPDEVLDLPGLSFKPNFRQWSGYLKASPGKYLHYWFVTSQRDPGSDPLVLWLNGGPGCSSLDGFLSENGPFHVNDDGATLYLNKFSWNKVANVLYLESPAGVGYSYSDDKNYQTNDDEVNDDGATLYLNKFSWNKVANVLYLESPAGVGYSYSDDKNYQTNDDEVAQNNYKALQSFFAKFPNFTQHDFYVFGESYGGIYTPTLSMQIASGPAKINFKGFAVGNGLSSYALNDQSLIYFGYYHGLFGEQLWADLNSNCCKNGTCNFYNSTQQSCSESVRQAFSIVYVSGLNVYALYLDCAGGVGPYKRFQRDMGLLFQNYRLRWDKALVKSRDVVTSQYQRNYTTMIDFYLKLLAQGLRVLVYNGDTDMACNFLGDQWFVEQLNMKKTTEYQHWLYDNQIAGFYEQFSNLTFLTVKVRTDELCNMSGLYYCVLHAHE
ncbi:UNVERIFIED_CONTAM: hypothetical protein FKN15_002873 [Acipenser sinensis]